MSLQVALIVHAKPSKEHSSQEDDDVQMEVVELKVVEVVDEMETKKVVEEEVEEMDEMDTKEVVEEEVEEVEEEKVVEVVEVEEVEVVDEMDEMETKEGMEETALLARCQGHCESASGAEPRVSFEAASPSGGSGGSGSGGSSGGSSGRPNFVLSGRSCRARHSQLKAVRLRCERGVRVTATFHYILACACEPCR
ncbi:unnamed protein product [Lampetra fluviatilis]